MEEARGISQPPDWKPSHEVQLVGLARSEGFEPPTPRFEVWCSIQLSYERRSPRRKPSRSRAGLA
jgi:hypothetical protein